MKLSTIVLLCAGIFTLLVCIAEFGHVDRIDVGIWRYHFLVNSEEQRIAIERVDTWGKIRDAERRLFYCERQRGSGPGWFKWDKVQIAGFYYGDPLIANIPSPKVPRMSDVFQGDFDPAHALQQVAESVGRAIYVGPAIQEDDQEVPQPPAP